MDDGASSPYSESARPEGIRICHHLGPENRLLLSQRVRDTSGGGQSDPPLCRCSASCFPGSLRGREPYHCDFDGCYFATDRAGRLSGHAYAHVENPDRTSCWCVSVGADAPVPKKHYRCRFGFFVYDRLPRVESHELRHKPREDLQKFKIWLLVKPSVGAAFQWYSDRLVKPDIFTSIAPAPLYTMIRNSLGIMSRCPVIGEIPHWVEMGPNLPTR